MQIYILPDTLKPLVCRVVYLRLPLIILMKRIILILLLCAPLWSLGQGTTNKPLPEYTYITPQMDRKQIDSIIVALGKHELSLSFDTVIYNDKKRIKEVEGALITGDQYFTLSSKDFKGITILNRNDTVAVIMGLLYPPRKK